MSGYKPTAASPTQPSAERVVSRVSAAASAANPGSVAVAYSGGRVSAALLHATLIAAQHTGVRVVGLHINHRLSAFADTWEQHCREQCARWLADGLPVTFASCQLRSRPQPGDSIEAWARRQRYGALKTLALQHGAHLVLLAHHRRDQAETLLLQALRSAGVAGLSGMPRAIERDGMVWARPWLAMPRSAIDAYVALHHIDFVEDDSNCDERYARNRLRHSVWPALEQAFPHAESAFAAAATWAQQAQACLDELAAIDLATLIDTRGLVLAALQTLSRPRQTNALRVWLREQTGAVPTASLVSRLADELFGSGSAMWPMDGGVLRRHRGRLQWTRATPSDNKNNNTSKIASKTARNATSVVTPRETGLVITRAGGYRLKGWGGVLRATRVKDGGVPLAWLAHVELKERAGGERFQAGVGRPARSLKKQFQAADVPAWQRTGPLLFSGGQLIFVPGLGLDARVLGLPGQTQVMLAWEAAALT